MSIVFFFLIGFGYLGVRDRVFITQINALFDNRPPLVTNAQINSDFQKMYFSRQQFSDWKKSHKAEDLKFSDLIGLENASAPFFSGRRNDRPVSFSVKKGEVIITVETTNPANLEEIADYTIFIGEQLNSQYRKSTEAGIKSLTQRIKDTSAIEQNLRMDYFFKTLLEIDKYSLRAKEGAMLFRFTRSNAIKQAGLPNHLILFFYSICGGVVGLAILTMRSIIVWFRSELEARS